MAVPQVENNRGAPLPCPRAVSETPGERKESNTMFCTNCGTKNADGARFCTGCGRRMPELPNPPAAAAAPAPAVAPASASAPIGKTRVDQLFSHLSKTWRWLGHFLVVGGVVFGIFSSCWPDYNPNLKDFAGGWLFFLVVLREGLLRIGSRAARFAKTAIVVNGIAFALGASILFLLSIASGGSEDEELGAAILAAPLLVLGIPAMIAAAGTDIGLGIVLLRHHEGTIGAVAVSSIVFRVLDFLGGLCSDGDGISVAEGILGLALLIVIPVWYRLTCLLFSEQRPAPGGASERPMVLNWPKIAGETIGEIVGAAAFIGFALYLKFGHL